MHILFVHQNFPAQFGPFAFRLAQRDGFRCTFLSHKAEGEIRGVHCVKYETKGGATEKNHYCSRTFENAVWHASAAFEALAHHPDIRPDLIVGHSGFGSTLFLRELYPHVPIINLFEYFYRVTDSDMDFRPDFPPRPIDRLRARARNAMILLDLDNCSHGYCPTRWQFDCFPREYHAKLRVLFDGIDTELWKPNPQAPRRIGNRDIPPETKIVSYVARGMESMRGFDQFMKVAKKIYSKRNDVLFVVVGQDRICYGGDERHTNGKTFKEWVLATDDYDLSRFHFTGLLPETELARLFALTDLHIYFTVPFVLSWSVFNALACGAVVLASDTAPVREVIVPGKTGLLANFFDLDGFAEQALEVLRHPGQFRTLGDNGFDLIRSKYTVSVCAEQFLEMCNSVR